jgi:hypothetical protein
LAVRLDEPPSDKPEDAGKKGGPWRSKWPSGLEHTASLLAISAILGYIILRLAYGQFYSGLGVDPSDVGLGYANTIANSADFLLYAILSYVVIAAIAAVVVGVLTFIVDRDFRRWRERFKHTILSSVPRVLMLLLLASFVRFLYIGTANAQAVREGRPVAYNRIGPFLVGLGAGAQPAVVRPTGKPSETRSIAQLSGRTLFYLGKADGIAVLYDVKSQSAIYVPLSAAVIEVSNCRVAEPVDPICKNRF